MRRLSRLVGLALLSPALAQSEPTVDIEINGAADNRVDVVILGDGYTAEQLDDYAVDAEAIVSKFVTEPPFEEFRNHFNIRRIEVISNESGADHPERDEYKDTALGATYNCQGIQRLLCVDYLAVNNVLDASVAPDERDIILVVVNDPEFGGAGGAFAVASTHASSADVMMHEIGHSFGYLADEYESSPPACNTSVEPAAANLTLETDRNLIKWNAGGGPPTGWIELDTIIPYQNGQPTDVVGLYDGGGYCTAGSGMYRPTFLSKMRANAAPFGPVNEEQLIKQIYSYVNPVETQSPVDELQIINHGDSQDYSITVIRPEGITANYWWYLDLNLMSNEETFSLGPSDLTPGPHQVFVWTHVPSVKVRNDPDRLLWSWAIWNVFVATEGDRDGDGVPDNEDAFPDDPYEQADNDGDLIGDNADTDDDNDTVDDFDDAFPLDPSEWYDTDGDGIGDNRDDPSPSQRFLLGIDTSNPLMDAIFEETGQSAFALSATVNGETISRWTGLTANLVDYQLYAIGQVQGQADAKSRRVLARLNYSQGWGYIVGNTEQPIASLAADDLGVLYGVSGDCTSGCTPDVSSEALFTIDTQTGQSTQVAQLGNGGDGEAIAFNPDDGMIYHFSGRAPDIVFEKISRSDYTITPIALSGADIEGSAILGFAYDSENALFYGSTWNRTSGSGSYISVSPAGVVTIIADLQYTWKDFTFWNLDWGGLVNIDGDFLPDFVDEFPNDGSEWADFDNDGVGNNSDVFPKDAAEWGDFDEDGVGDNADTDDDNDGVPDVSDVFPFNSLEWDDTDGDGVGDNADAFPNDPGEWKDTDGDGVGNNADDDDDGDGVADIDDEYPLGRFDDVRPDHWAFTFVEAIARAGITSGCGNNNYCPADAVTRAQMAVFLERGMRGSGYGPPAAAGSVFLDVAPNDFAASFIEQLAADGITAGCGNGNYCPDDVVTRDQMAVFLLRAKYGSGYSPPAATGVFGDVPLSHWSVHWIEQLAAEGITAGCGSGNYCPDAEVTRDQMAVFLVRTFGL